MIVLDTHIWIWWVQGDRRMSAAHAAALSANEPAGLGQCDLLLARVCALLTVDARVRSSSHVFCTFFFGAETLDMP